MGGRGSSFSQASETYRDLQDVSEEETDALFESSYNAWREQLTQDEFEAVQDYTGGLYEDLNGYLRTGRVPANSDYTEDELKAYAKNFESAMNKAKFPFNLNVHRWSGSGLLKQLVPNIVNMTPQQQARELNNYVGSILTDKGVTSTSTQHVHYGNVRYDIKIHQGTSAHYVRPLSNVRHEMEVATNVGTSYVLKGASVSEGKLKVDLEIYREGRRGRQKQVRNAGTKGNGLVPLF